MVVDLPEAAATVQVDVQTLYEAAVADRIAGRNVQAIARLDQLLEIRPDDVDARLNLGLALLALDRLEEAETAFLRVLERAPQYIDAWVGLIRVQQRRGDMAAARQIADEALRAAPHDLSLVRLRAELEPSSEWRIDVNASRSQLSQGLTDWTEVRLGVSRAIGDWRVGGAVEATERFDLRDTYIEGRVELSVPEGLTYVAVGGTPEADYRPEVTLLVGGERRFARTLAGTLDVSVARYAAGTVTGIHPGARVDLSGGRVQLSARWINVWDETGEYRTGYATSARWQVTESLALRAGFAEAPESSEGVTVDVRSWSSGADLALGDRVILRAGYVAEDRGAYERHEVAIGIGWRF